MKPLYHCYNHFSLFAVSTINSESNEVLELRFSPHLNPSPYTRILLVGSNGSPYLYSVILYINDKICNFLF